MKKILVASSALVAVAFAGQAQASEKISLSVSGYMEQWIGVADQDNNAVDNVNAFQSDTEVHFKGATTLDNGIEVGAAIEFEGEGGNSGTMVDEQYLYVNGGFGQVKLGAEDGAAADMGISAPAVGPVGANDGDMPNWVTLAVTPDTVPAGGDSKRLTYYTPSLGGFKAGISYADDDSSENNDKVTSGDNRVSGGVEYSGDFDGVSVAVAVTGEHMGEGEWYSVGTKVGFGAFTIGGSAMRRDAEFGYGQNVTANIGTGTGGNRTTADDDKHYDIGVSYAMDAASVSLTYAYAEDDSSNTSTGSDEVSAIDLGLAYTLGAGVTWKSSVFWFDSEGQDAGTADDNEGYGVVTGLALSF
ncbi:porin [Thalassospira sp. MIT1370]|uniref:porin n=1 Tax=unclassified Thalassospira TaxID=2648997 RepID=UPI00399BB153